MTLTGVRCETYLLCIALSNGPSPLVVIETFWEENEIPKSEEKNTRLFTLLNRVCF